jgi:hypothetical protein
VQGLALVAVLLVLAGGSYASAFFSRKVFMEEFNAMNHFYKQTLFLTGKNEREKAQVQYQLLLPSYRAFQDKYSQYQPFALKGDQHLVTDLAQVAKVVTGVGVDLKTGDLQQVHLALEQVRPVFQDIFKRNGFSLLSVTLVDFHDTMEQVLAAAQAHTSEQLPGRADALKSSFIKVYLQRG